MNQVRVWIESLLKKKPNEPSKGYWLKVCLRKNLMNQVRVLIESLLKKKPNEPSKGYQMSA